MRSLCTEKSRVPVPMDRGTARIVSLNSEPKDTGEPGARAAKSSQSTGTLRGASRAHSEEWTRTRAHCVVAVCPVGPRSNAVVDVCKPRTAYRALIAELSAVIDGHALGRHTIDAGIRSEDVGRLWAFVRNNEFNRACRAGPPRLTDALVVSQSV